MTLERDLKTGIIEIKHTGLIKHVTEAVVIDDGITKGKCTP